MLPAVLRSVTPRELAERIAAERRGAPFLVHVDGDGRQRIVELSPHTTVSIGRQPAAEVALTWDTQVSRVHAVLERVGDEWTLTDDGLSRNGSFVNGRRLQGQRRLGDGDAITIGNTLLVFRAPAQPGAATTVTTQEGAPPELTAAQARVLQALCGPDGEGGFTGPIANREIAEQLFLGVETVKSHLHAMFDLFGIADLPQNRKRGELVRRAIETGLVRSRSG